MYILNFCLNMAETDPSSVEIEIKDTVIKDYNHFRRLAKMLTHFKVKRSSYYHHFLVLGISCDEIHADVITVAHYTSSAAIFTDSSTGPGKFVIESVDKDSKLFDFQAGLFWVQRDNYPKSTAEHQVALNRLTDRLNEREYNISSNNCEHVVQYILTGESSSEQVESNRSRADSYSFVGECKEVGFKTALLVSALGAIAGSLVRRVYVKLIIAAMIGQSMENEFIINCGKQLGSNMIVEASNKIEQAESLSVIKGQSSKLDEIKTKLSQEFVCNLAEQLTKEAVMKTCLATLVVCIGLETIILFTYVFHSLNSKRQKNTLSAKEYSRILTIYVFSGYGSTLVAVSLGSVTFLTAMKRPALCYFIVVLVSGFVCRYLLTCLSGFLFDKCCCKSSFQCCENSCNIMFCCDKKIRFALIIVLLLVSVLIALVFLLK